VQHEISKGTSGPLAKKTNQAWRDLEKASEKVNKCIDEKVKYDSVKQGPGRPPELNKKIESALRNETEALKTVNTAQAHQKSMKEAVKEISNTYHPVDIKTGELKKTEDVSESLNQCFGKIETIAAEARLTEKSLKRIKKAGKVVISMVATIFFFHMIMQRKVEALDLPPVIKRIVIKKMIPAYYLSTASKKAKSADERHRLKRKSEEILSSIKGIRDSFPGMTHEEWDVIETVANDCSEVFQRSSSCVEGRNGQLALRHHSFHRLSNRKLSALTDVHNFFIRRKDNTTAAERFFDSKPKDVFEFLLENMDLPMRPAKKRAA